MKMMLQWQQLPYRFKLWGSISLEAYILMTQRQCAEVDEIADYMVMSAFMIFIQ